MKKILSILILSVIAFSNIAFAEDAFIIEREFVPVNTGQMELQPFELEPIPFEPIPFNPDDPYTDDPALEVHLEFELMNDGRPQLNWTRYNGPNFLHYKILHDQDDPNLYYPEFGFIEYYEDQNKTRYIWDEQLPVGENFMRVCVITTDSKRGCSNTISHFMSQAFYDNLEREREIQMEDPDLKPEIKPELDREREPIVREDVQKNEKRSNFLAFIWKNIGIILAFLAIIIAASGFTFASKRKQKSISKYMNKIDDTFTEYKMKAKRCEAELYRLKDIIDDELKSGKIDDGTFALLSTRIENYMIEIQKQIVNEKFGGLPVSLKEEMFKMMEDGEITESELETMQKLIKRSELSGNEQDSLLAQMKDFKKQDELMKKKGKS